MIPVTSPDLSSARCMKLEAKHGTRNYKPLPVVIARGEGVWVWDLEGKKYMDCLAGYSALNQGYGHPHIVAAAKAQLDTGVTLTSRAFFNTRLGEFCEKITTLSGFDRVLPMCSGAEAVETAIKIARKYAYTRRDVPDGAAKIIAFENNFHGRTTTIVGFSSEKQYRENFGPFAPGFEVLPFGDAAALRAAVDGNTAAVLLEPIQGEGGIIVPPDGFLTEVQSICRDSGALFIADEIQSGLGRTGKVFAYENEEGVKPDMMLLAKALTGGMYPMSVVLGRADVMDVLDPGDHGSTYGGAPYGAAVAIAALEVLENERLVENAATQGAHLMQGLRDIDSPHVELVRGRGLWAGVVIKKSSGPAKPFVKKLAAEGILCKETHEQVLRISPPLVVTREEIDWALERFARVLGGRL